MNINNYKKIVGLLSIAIVVAVGFKAEMVKNEIFGKVNIAQADDDEEEGEKDDEEYNDSQVINTSPDQDVAQTEQTEIIYTKLSDTVSTTTTTITRHDSDGDGMYDDEDPHPGINENFIVEDKNLNGIDDRYEQ